MANKFLRENLPELQVKSETRVPSKAAYGAGKALGRVVGSLFRK
jgi:hypothetical protein